MTLSVNSCGNSEEDKYIHLLQNIVTDARPPTNDPINWPETGAFVNNFQETSFFCNAFTTFFPYGHGYPTF